MLFEIRLFEVLSYFSLLQSDQVICVETLGEFSNRVPISDELPWSRRNSSTETEFFRHTVCIIDRPFVPTKNKVEKDLRNKRSTFSTSSVRAATWSAVQPSWFRTFKSAPDSIIRGQKHNKELSITLIIYKVVLEAKFCDPCSISNVTNSGRPLLRQAIISGVQSALLSILTLHFWSIN